MAEFSVEQENQIAAAKARAHMRDVANVFLQVFGPPDARTPHGKLILDTLANKFGKGLPKNVVDAHGQTDEPMTFRRFGHYDVLEAINDIINWKESE